MRLLVEPKTRLPYTNFDVSIVIGITCEDTQSSIFSP
jgi:hypothetical protein